MEPEQNKELYKKIIGYIEEYKNEWTENKLFIVKTIDRVGTVFDLMSKNNDIGVLAKSKTVGHVLLFLLQVVVDDYDGLLDLAMEFENDSDEDEHIKKYENSGCIKSLVEILCKFSLKVWDVDVYSLDDKIPIYVIKQQRRKFTYYKELKFVDIWNIEKIKQAINNLKVK